MYSDSPRPRPHYWLVLGLAAALLITRPGDASADPAAATVGAEAPMFEMPSLSPEREVGAELMVGTIDFLPENLTMSAVELFGKLSVSPRLILRTRLPIAYANGAGVSGTTLGNIELGGDYILSTPAGSSPGRWSVGGGVYLPTSSDGGESGVVANAHSVYRLTHPGRYMPETTTLALHGDYRRESGQLFFQGQFGAQLYVIEHASNSFILRMGLGGGTMVSPQLALIAELTTTSDFLDDADHENFLHVLDFGMRYRVGRSGFGARFYLPLDASTRQGLDIIGFAVDYRGEY